MDQVHVAVEVAKDRYTVKAVHFVILQGPFNVKDIPEQALKPVLFDAVANAITGVELILKTAGIVGFEVVHSRVIVIGEEK